MIVVGNVIQAADAINDSGQPPKQDRDETGNGSQNKSWRHPKGIKVSDDEMASINIKGDAFHPEWNYTKR